MIDGATASMPPRSSARPSTPRPHAQSATTTRATAFVHDHEAAAATLGERIARHVQDPDALAAALQAGLPALADAVYLAGQRRVAPGIGTLHGVRLPLLEGVARAFRRATRAASPDLLLRVAARLLREEHQEPHWLAMGILERTVQSDPERTWQLIRLAARTAGDWIAVDTLAHAAARGILLEPYRWAELEQLAFSPSRWERRLIGSTIATLPSEAGPGADLASIAERRALPLIAQVIGDREPDVQKALSWACRNLAKVAPAAVLATLDLEADTAARTDDGHRAWVIRDCLAKLPPEDADRLRNRLEGVRRRPNQPSTSIAARTAAAFGALPDPAAHPEPPLF